MTDFAKALNTIPTKTLLKLSYIASTLDSEARWNLKESQKRPESRASIRMSGKAAAYADSAKALWDLIEDIESNQ